MWPPPRGLPRPPERPAVHFEREARRRPRSAASPRCCPNSLQQQFQLFVGEDRAVAQASGPCTGPAIFAHRDFVRNPASILELWWISKFPLSRPCDGQNTQDPAAQELARARQVGHVAHYLTGAIAADSEASQRADVAIQHILPIKSPKNCSILSRWGLQGVRSSANDGQVGENRVAQK